MEQDNTLRRIMRQLTEQTQSNYSISSDIEPDETLTVWIETTKPLNGTALGEFAELLGAETWTLDHRTNEDGEYVILAEYVIPAADLDVKMMQINGKEVKYE